jgi:lysophospholipase L1-like esterase
MRATLAAILTVCSFSGTAFAVERQSCDIPGYLLFDGSELSHVSQIVTKEHRLNIAVVGTGSSILAGPDGPRSAYPARLEATLRERLPGTAVKVITLVRTRLTAEDLAQGMAKLLIDEKPDLVVWQTGTIDAMRRLDPDNFRAALEDGVDSLRKGGADVVLMNQQYSPRTETMITLGPYVDSMRVVSREREVPLFDRLSIMRHWSESGTFDLYAGAKDNVLAYRVHDCIGRGIAALIIEAAHLKAADRKAGQ